MNETMRQEFYEGRWKQEQTECHSIFLGQGDYPLKGMHFLLEAMGRLKGGLSGSELYVAGAALFPMKQPKDRCRLSAYGKYLLVLIRLYELQDRVIVLGRLSAEEMKAQFLRSSVFVCPSVMENSPNTIGEAMLLGVPVVASRTGGIPSMVEDGVTGLLFHNEDVEDLADSIDRVWSDHALAKELSVHERIGLPISMMAIRIMSGYWKYTGKFCNDHNVCFQIISITIRFPFQCDVCSQGRDYCFIQTEPMEGTP